MKIVLRLFALLLILAALAVGGLVLFQDRLISRAIEDGGSYGTGVPTKVENVDAGLFSGKLELGGLSIAQPEGFQAEHPFLRLGTGHARWDNQSLLGDRIRVDELVLDGVEVALERGANGSNWGVILKNLERLSPGGGQAPAPKSEGPGKKLSIGRLELDHVRTSLRVSGLPVGDGTYSVEIPRIVLEDFESGGSTGEMLGKLFATVIDAVLQATVEGGGGLPKDLLKDLDKQLKGLGEGVLGDVRKETEKVLKDVPSDIEKKVEGALDKVLKPRR